MQICFILNYFQFLYEATQCTDQYFSILIHSVPTPGRGRWPPAATPVPRPAARTRRLAAPSHRWCPPDAGCADTRFSGEQLCLVPCFGVDLAGFMTRVACAGLDVTSADALTPNPGSDWHTASKKQNHPNGNHRRHVYNRIFSYICDCNELAGTHGVAAVRDMPGSSQYWMSQTLTMGVSTSDQVSTTNATLERTCCPGRPARSPAPRPPGCRTPPPSPAADWRPG